ncbi:MAG: DUF354 domain-containing protein [Candidatus Bathyarchaeia archaeon]
MAQNYDFWIDISNTPQVHVARALIKSLREYSFYITAFKRGEVEELMREFGINGKVFGEDKYNPTLKGFSFMFRTLILILKKFPKVKVLISFENAMPIPAARIRRIKSVFLADNELKFYQTGIFQRFENILKGFCDFVIVPKVCEEEFRKFFKDKEIYTYNGYKEHIYISDYEPDTNFTSILPFREYVVLRPESLTSHYVLHRESIVPKLVELLTKNGVNVVYLPRNNEERDIIGDLKKEVYIPPKALNGLDLCYFSKATLTGSGTMAREAALLGVPAISFFPGKRLLSVDRSLAETGRIFHSRDPKEIVEYVLDNWNKRKEPDFERAKKVKKEVVAKIKEVIDNHREN